MPSTQQTSVMISHNDYNTASGAILDHIVTVVRLARPLPCLIPAKCWGEGGGGKDLAAREASQRRRHFSPGPRSPPNDEKEATMQGAGVRQFYLFTNSQM